MLTLVRVGCEAVSLVRWDPTKALNVVQHLSVWPCWNMGNMGNMAYEQLFPPSRQQTQPTVSWWLLESYDLYECMSVVYECMSV